MSTRLPYTLTDVPDSEDYEVGFYLPTETFKAIPEHVAVMRKGTGELIAVTGPSEPGASAEACARLFCAAPKLRDALRLQRCSQCMPSEPDDVVCDACRAKRAALRLLGVR